MKKIATKDWVPSDGMKLEDNALTAIKCPGNSLVVAGPGAGKTELLAQKACYLLQTNVCLYPKRILAISFKRDAAYNLKKRVNLRCDAVLSRRFESYTFDAFAKQLLDRFYCALPEEYKIKKDYEIFFDSKAVDNIFRSIDETIFNTTNISWIKYLTESPLPLPAENKLESIRQLAWMQLVRATRSKLNFQMIMRLAAYIMFSNLKLKLFLQQTYSHVFLDEFQDTTQLQYDFLNSCFEGSSVNYTAVGDDKQRIMGWAGALKNIFEEYEGEKSAARIPLTMNFRSAPILVTLQNHLVKELLNKAEFATPSPKWRLDQGEALLFVFKDPNQETKVLYERVKEWMEVDKIACRDICILIKSNLGVYANKIINYFKEHGVSARDESEYQDFLTEEVVVFLIAFFRLLFDKKTSGYSDVVFDFLANLNSSFSDEQLLRLRASISVFLKETGKKYKVMATKDSIKEVIVEVGKFCGIGKIRNAYPQYRQGTFLNETVGKLLSFLQKEFEQTGDIVKALDMVEGKDSISIMTIHKSKGLEYHTVIFVGLEDGAFWSFRTQEDEDKNAFFVALSRAKERVVFTFCLVRENKFGKTVKNTASNIEVIFKKLESSKIVESIDYTKS